MSAQRNQFKFSFTTPGLPDFCVVNFKGEVDPDALMSYLKIGNRKQRKNLTTWLSSLASSFKMAHLKKLEPIEYYLDQGFRRALFLQIRNKRKVTKNINWSFEYATISRYNERKKERINADLANGEAMPEGENLCISIEDNDMAELRGRIDINYIRPDVISLGVFDSALALWPGILEELSEGIGNKDVQLYSALAFSYATIFGPAFFEDAITAMPRLMAEYKYVVENSLSVSYAPKKIITLEKKIPKKKEIEVPPQKVETPNPTETDIDLAEKFPEDIQTCLSLIKEQAAVLHVDTLSPLQLKHLSQLTLHAHNLAKKGSSVEIFLNVNAAILGYLSELALVAKVSGIEDGDFVRLFSGSWERFLAENSTSLFVNMEIEDTLTTVKRDVQDAVSAKIKAENAVIQAEISSGDLEAQTPTTFLEKKKRDESFAVLEGLKATAKKLDQEADDAMHEAILPPLVSFKNLEEKATYQILLPELKQAAADKVYESISQLSKEHLVRGNPTTETEDATPESLEDLSDDEIIKILPAFETLPKVSSKTEKELSSSMPEEIIVAAVVPPLLDPEETALSVVEPESEVSSLAAVGKTSKPEPTPDTKPEVEHSSFKQITTTLKDQIEVDYRTQGSISADNLNTFVLYCLGHDFLNIGHKAAKTGIKVCSTPEELINPELLESAYFGMNVWDSNGRAFERSQRLLNAIDQKKVDGWLERRTVDKSVAPLLFCACFQTMLWGGNSSMAPTLLNQIKNHFPVDAAILLTELIHHINKGTTFSLEQFAQRKNVSEETGLKAESMLRDWQDKVTQATRGWVPLRLALQKELKNGVFAPIAKAISRNNRKAIQTVRAFVENYKDQNEIRGLMAQSVMEFTSAKIEPNARELFARTTNDLREIASLWMSEQTSSKDPSSEIKDFIQELPERLGHIALDFGAMHDKSVSLEGYFAAKSAEKNIRNLLQAMAGDTDAIWSEERANLWLLFPQILMSGPDGTVEPIGRIRWALDQSDNNFDLKMMYQNAFDDKAYHVAHLLLTYMEESGIDVAENLNEVRTILTDNLRDLKKRKEHIDLSIDTANVSGLLEDDRHNSLKSELEYIDDEIMNCSPLTDLAEIAAPLEEINNEIDLLYGPRIKKLTADYKALLLSAQTSVGLDVVSPAWQEQMEEALKNNDVPVAEEMNEALTNAQKDGAIIREDPTDINNIFSEFLSVEDEIYKFLKETTDPKIIIKGMDSDGPLPLDLGGKAKHLKPLVVTMGSWRGHKPPVAMSGEYYAKVTTILKTVGIEVDGGFNTTHSKKLKYLTSGGFVKFVLRVKACCAGAPFPDFGENQTPDLGILVSHKGWDVLKLESLFETDLLGENRFILISTTPLNLEQRNSFAAYCKRNHKTIFLIDLAMLLYLSSLPDDTSSKDVIRNFLHLTIPMTYYNTYVGDKASPPDPEMRYGRLAEIEQLLDMNQGAAIVFGGRQLGKSTILSQVENRFHDPTHSKYAISFLADSHFSGSAMEESTHEECEKRFWSIVYDKFDHRLLRKKENLSAEAMRTAIKDTLISQKDLRVMIICDEVDTLLNLDHRHNFKLFRSIRELVNSQEIQGRFKFIISGLQNVKRFEDSPNYPLNQLGRSLNISIMRVSDASKLVKEPLRTYGFRFENSLVSSRILSVTNRHPGLIQIFCYELVKHMASEFSGQIGKQVISDSNITQTFNKEEVKRLIRDRFEMTLNLDHRYTVIIYSLALEGRVAQSFSAAQVRDASVVWLPEMAKKTDMQIEAILDELVGLGVIRKAVGQGYALRNSNIMMLLGSQNDIMMRLMHHEDVLKLEDPMERHAYNATTKTPSPLTYRDEKQLLGMLTPEQKDSAKKTGISTSQKYTVNMISGSRALGLEHLEETLPYIEDFSMNWSGKDKNFAQKVHLDSSFADMTTFDTKLRRNIDMAQKKAQFILIKVTGTWDAEEIQAALEISLQARECIKKSYQPCKVVFALYPAALWRWISSIQNVAEQEKILPHICLDLWKTSGLRLFLDQIDFAVVNDRVERLHDYSRGWYGSLCRLNVLKQESKDVVSISKFGAKYKKITELTIKESVAFLESTGVENVIWAKPLLRKLISEQNGINFNKEDIKILIEMDEIDGLNVDLAGQALDWLMRLSLIQPMKASADSQELMYQIEAAVMSSLTKTHE